MSRLHVRNHTAGSKHRERPAPPPQVPEGNQAVVDGIAPPISSREFEPVLAAADEPGDLWEPFGDSIWDAVRENMRQHRQRLTAKCCRTEFQEHHPITRQR